MPAALDGPSSSGLVPAAEATSVALRASVILTSLAGVIAVVVAGVVSGGNAALGAFLGALITVVFFAAGQYAIGRILSGNADFALSGALLVYLTQILVLFGLIAVLKDATWLNPKAFAATIVVCTVIWLVAQLWTLQRIKVLTVEPTPSTDTGSEVEQ